jgi:hypothetical protein
MIFSRGRRGAESSQGRDGECAYKAMGTLTSYVGAIFVDRPLTKGSTGFCWINIKRKLMRSTNLPILVTYKLICVNFNHLIRRTPISFFIIRTKRRAFIVDKALGFLAISES